ncbi:DNA-directed RNA polymerase subunit RPC12/RpoP [Bradyrhizobium sp. USDA 3364]
MTPPITIHFACSNCGTVYSALQERGSIPLNSSGSFDCRRCGKLVHHWAGIYDYCEWRIVTVPHKKNGPGE